LNQEGVEVKRLVTVITLAILVAGLVLLDLSDTDISVADTTIPDSEVTGSEADNPDSATATIMITMLTLSDEY
jgi:hypothetical protein